MSYDVYLVADVGGPEPVYLNLLDVNVTYNLTPMFIAAGGSSPRDWNDKPASEVREQCLAVLTAFNADQAKFEALNPANGWGDFNGARAFIQEVADACAKAPRATVRVC